MRSLSIHALISALLAFATFFSAVRGETPIDLGLAAPYAILAGSTVTSTGVVGTVVTGSIGVFPGSAVTGFPPAVLNGAIDSANGASGGAQGALTTAYNVAAAKPFNTTLSNQDLGGMTLFPGVYRFDGAAAMNGALTLDARGDAAAVWVFQIGSSLLIAEGSAILFKDSIGNPDYVYWQVGTSATLALGVPMVGNILAYASIVVNAGVVVNGRCLARNAAVTLDNSVITKPSTVSFGATQTISGITLTQYNAAPAVNSVTLKEAIAESMTGVLPSNIKNFAVSEGLTSVLRGAARALSTSSILLNYDVVVSSALTSGVLQGQINAAVSSGAFTTSMQTAATANGATALETATSSIIATVTETSSNSGGSTSASSSDSSLTDGAIAGIVIGGFIGLVLFGMLAYFFLFSSTNKA